MFRTFVVLLTTLALAASGVALYTHIRRDGVDGVLRSLDFRKSGPQVAANDLMAAAHELERSYEVNRTYTNLDLSRFGGVQLVFASSSGFCIQVENTKKWYHLAGPGGTPREGVC
jgi:hypothetical protein